MFGAGDGGWDLGMGCGRRGVVKGCLGLRG